MEPEQRQEMVEEADAGLDTRTACPIEREREPERGLGGRPQDGRLTTGRRARLGTERPEQHVVLGRPPHGHPDGARKGPDDDALRLQPVGERFVRHHGEEVRRGRRAVVARGDERRPKPLALRGRRFDIPESWLTQRRRRDRGGRAGDRRRGTPLGENRGGLGVRERIADPQRREPERLRHRPHDDEVLELVDPRGARACTELHVRLVDDEDRVGTLPRERDELLGLDPRSGRVVRVAGPHEIRLVRDVHDRGAVKPRRDPVQRVRRLRDGRASARPQERLGEEEDEIVRARTDDDVLGREPRVGGGAPRAARDTSRPDSRRAAPCSRRAAPAERRATAVCSGRT